VPRGLDRRLTAGALLAGAGAVLVAAFVLIAIRVGTGWPWNVVVHEDGRRTFLQTILYFEHAARELPLDVVLGTAIGGSVAWAFPPGTPVFDRDVPRPWTLASATAVVVAIIVGGTLLDGGVSMLLDNLLQNHTRPGSPLAWGSHWRYHLLERLGLILLSIGLAGLARLCLRPPAPGSAGAKTAAGSVGAYLALTLVFAGGWAAFVEPFRDPRYLGHQAREVLTHALVTGPLAWAACLLAVRSSRRTAPILRPGRAGRAEPVAVGAGVLGILLLGYVGVASLASDAASHGQTKDLVMLVFPHFFEHAFTYVLTPLVARLTYTLAVTRSRPWDRVR
jgi:hypothetical protein